MNHVGDLHMNQREAHVFVGWQWQPLEPPVCWPRPKSAQQSSQLERARQSPCLFYIYTQDIIRLADRLALLLGILLSPAGHAALGSEAPSPVTGSGSEFPFFSYNSATPSGVPATWLS